MKLPISAVVITLNEGVKISDCLASLEFCEEILVVDSGSQDDTQQVAKRYTDKVVLAPWRGYVAQKNYAVSLAQHDWVLSVDADERVPKELENEIRELFLRGIDFAAFKIPRMNLHSGQWIRHGGWFPDKMVRLFDRKQGTWTGEELHERWTTQGEVGELHSALLHYSFDSISDQVIRNDKYSTLGAAQLQKRGEKFSWSRLALKPLGKFFECYFVKRGFKDGFRGLVIAVSAAYSVFLRWAKLWELEQRA